MLEWSIEAKDSSMGACVSVLADSLTSGVDVVASLEVELIELLLRSAVVWLVKVALKRSLGVNVVLANVSD